MFLHRAVLAPLTLLLLAPLAAVRAAPGDELFEKKIRPVLTEHCYKCHGPDAKKRKGGLRLDTRAGLRTGGDSGPALVPGNSKASLLLKALRHEGPEMPPSGRLDSAIVADFARWIDLGAPDPRTDTTAASTTAKPTAPLWSLQPMRRPPVPLVKDAAWPRSPIDRFILAKLDSAGLAPAADADPLTLLRRLHFALTGLPPTLEDIEHFHQSAIRNPQSAMEHAVDRLLASPHFGEHWARHWMDLVCYSETHGFEHDPLIHNMWRYRDYLIRAFNADVPYDQLVREHLAGDLLPPRWHRTLGINEAPIGTAYFRFVELYPTPVDPKTEESNVLEAQIDTFGKTFQGLTLACARCHDHKFDPITARDYHALYGMFASSRVAMHAVDDPRRLHAHDAALRRLKEQLRLALAEHWRGQLLRWPTQLIEDAKDAEAQRLYKAVAAAQGKPGHVLFPLTKSLRKVSAAVMAQEWTQEQERRQSFNRKAFRVFADFAQGDLAGWHVHGQSWAEASAPGDFAIEPKGERLLTGIYPRGRYTHLLSDRHPGALRSPSFPIDMKYISVLACGTNEARLRLIVENFHGDELLFATVMPKLKGGELRWVTLPIRTQYWTGRRAYLEAIPRDDMTYAGRIPDVAKLPTDGRSGVGIRAVVFHEQPAPPEMLAPLPAELWEGGGNLQERFKATVQDAIDAWSAGRASDPQAELLDALLRLELLANQAPAGHPLAALVQAYRAEEAKVPLPHRVPGVVDEEGFEVPLYTRGNYRFAKEPVPRRYLEVLHGPRYALQPRQSGRLQLAQELTSPANPLTARVLVNRLWQHLFGAGLVRSVDNFGHLGEQPSHPELLDYLATEFVEQGWSLKKLLRTLVLSRAYQLSAQTTAAVMETDPDNRLWSHASLRRLSAEEIRDALLQTSGRLDRRQFGQGIPLPPRHYQDFYVPAAGPLDGAGRRTIYLEVRRNYLSAFLLTFDWPRPLMTTGQRDVTNVPAQGLTLLNDPFVHQQAERLAQRMLSTVVGSAAERVRLLYRLAFAREPAADERERALALLRAHGGPAWETEPRAWRLLALALFNQKEFIFVR